MEYKIGTPVTINDCCKVPHFRGLQGIITSPPKQWSKRITIIGVTLLHYIGKDGDSGEFWFEPNMLTFDAS